MGSLVSGSTECIVVSTVSKDATGPSPVNFRTTGLSGNNSDGSINHTFTWDSSTGDLSDLAKIGTRERVEFDQNPLRFMPAYGPYVQQDGRANLSGSTLIKDGKPGSAGGAGDVHSPGYGPFFDDEVGFTQGEGTMSAVQTYEFKDKSGVWLPIPGAQFTIVRTIAQKGSNYFLTTTKSGQGMSAKAKIKMYASRDAWLSK